MQRHRKLQANEKARALFAAAATGALDSKSDARQRITDAFGDDLPDVVQRVILAELTELAEKSARSGYHGSTRPLELRQEADERTLAWVGRLEKVDRLVTSNDDEPDPTAPPRTTVLDDLDIRFEE